MIDVTQDIHSLTTFKRNTTGLMKHMKKTGRPLVLTVKGKAEAVVLDAKTYQDVASQLDAVASIRRGLAQVRKGMGRPADDVFDKLEREGTETGWFTGLSHSQADADILIAIATSAARRLSQRETGYAGHARLQRASRTVPTLPHGPRRRLIPTYLENSSSARVIVVRIVFFLSWWMRRNLSTYCTFGTGPCVRWNPKNSALNTGAA